ALDAVLRERFGLGFRHNDHSLRVVDHHVRDGRGLDLTAEVRDAILTHTGESEPDTLEGKTVRLVDRVAYINHDIDDAVRAGVIAARDLPREPLDILGPTGPRRIDALVHDLVETSEEAGDIVQGEVAGRAMAQLREFMFARVYLGPEATREHAKIGLVIRSLFDNYCTHPQAIPDSIPAGPVECRV